MKSSTDRARGRQSLVASKMVLAAGALLCALLEAAPPSYAGDPPGWVRRIMPDPIGIDTYPAAKALTSGGGVSKSMLHTAPNGIQFLAPADWRTRPRWVHVGGSIADYNARAVRGNSMVNGSIANTGKSFLTLDRALKGRAAPIVIYNPTSYHWDGVLGRAGNPRTLEALSYILSEPGGETVATSSFSHGAAVLNEADFAGPRYPLNPSRSFLSATAEHTIHVVNDADAVRLPPWNHAFDDGEMLIRYVDDDLSRAVPHDVHKAMEIAVEHRFSGEVPDLHHARRSPTGGFWRASARVNLVLGAGEIAADIKENGVVEATKHTVVGVGVGTGVTTTATWTEGALARVAVSQAPRVVAAPAAWGAAGIRGVGFVASKAAAPLAAAHLGYTAGRWTWSGVGNDGRRFLTSMAGFYFGDANDVYTTGMEVSDKDY